MLRELTMIFATGGILLLAGCSSVVRDRSALQEELPYAETSDSEELGATEYDTLQYSDDLDDQQAQQMMESIRLANEYYAYGVQANAAERWTEAQYNFDRALSILQELNVDPEDNGAVGYSYVKLLDEIRSEFKYTILNLENLTEGTSRAAFVDRYEEINDYSKLAHRYEKIDDFGKLKDEKVVTVVDTKVTYDVPMVMNEKVENCLIYFQNIAHDFFQGALTRSGKYTTLMAKILEEENVPRDLVYLPLIESGFKTNAYSWANAVGPWQFISSTGRRFGMERDHWFDERRDFEKSTRGAARYLKYLHDRYDDWYLALAAYNGGEGRVDQVTKREGTMDYWKLTKLKRETKDYVPLYLAATIIAKNPEKYGFEPFYDDPLEYETVTINKSLDLYEAANALGTTYDYLKSLNPELLRKQTPSKENYALRIPVNSSSRFWAAYDQMKSPRATTLAHHEIKKGETLSSIAKEYQVSVQSLADANNLKKKQGLTEGRTILIPVPSLTKNTRERKSVKTRTLGDPAKSGEHSDQYVVRKGDSLAEIAAAHGTTPSRLRVRNGLDESSRIYPGQVLHLNTDKQIVAQRRSNSKTGKVMTYKARPGDTLDKLAKSYGVSVAQLSLLNGLEGNRRLRPGQLLNVPVQTKAVAKPKSSGGILVYIVKAGDTLWDIAKAFSCSVDDLIRLNNLSSHRLNVGDQLRIGRD
jgi:membrane-bound lytic murein transglycosylase D